MSKITRAPQKAKNRLKSAKAALMRRRRSQYGSRHFKELFDNETPYGHKVQTDRTKKIPRQDKHPLCEDD